MTKTTKKQALETYDTFHGVLRCLNGGTKEENERSAAHCYERLKEIADNATELISNPSKHLSNDEWLFSALSELPKKAWRFRVRYNLV